MAQHSFSLPEVADITAVELLYDQLLPLTIGAGDVSLDASRVARISTPCIQLLLALEKSLNVQDRRIVMGSATDPVQDAFCALGLRSTLEAWSREP